ncbi:MAG TPA: hypothetical protein VF498_00020 [Anaerolineales bacterium]
MERYVREFQLGLGKINSQHIKLVLALLALTLFVLGAGAPGMGSGIGG